jgi:hypothetical protein
MQRSLITKVLAWLCIALAVNLGPEAGFAQQTAPPEEPGPVPADTLGVDPKANTPEINDRIFPYGAEGDSLSQTEVLATRSLYREWWLWTVAVVVVATTIVLYAGGKDEEGAEDLPGFPDPPER